MSSTTEVSGYTVDLMRELGRGGFGTVYKGYKTGERSVAIKRVCKDEKTKASSEAVRFHYFKNNIDSNQIVTVHNVTSLCDSMWIIMEFCDLGDLNNYFKQYHQATKETQKIVTLMFQIILGINYLHEKNIVHRDIKPGNILLKSTESGVPMVKLGDFGLSKILDPEDLTSAMSSNVGTLMFKAPEFWDHKPGDKVYYHRNVDVYSAGLTFAAMLQAEPDKRLVPKPEGSLYGSETNMPVGFVSYTRHANRQPEFAVVVENTKDDFKTKMVKKLIVKMTNVSPLMRLQSSIVKKALTKILNAKKTPSSDFTPEIIHIEDEMLEDLSFLSAENNRSSSTFSTSSSEDELQGDLRDFAFRRAPLRPHEPSVLRPVIGGVLRPVIGGVLRPVIGGELLPFAMSCWS